MPVIPPLIPEPSTAELNVNRLNTRAFIAANPTLLSLTPRTPVRDGEGQRMIPGVPRVAQVARLIDQGTVGAGGDVSTAQDGFQRKVGYQLLLPHDGVVGLYDYWVDAAGVRWEVNSLLPYNGYEVRAEVTRYGETG